MRIHRVLLLFICAAPFGYAQKESLLIGPGDTLHIKVLEAPELEQTVRVTDAGTVPLVIGGNVSVAGLSPGAAASAVRDALVTGHYLLNPHVSLTQDQMATQNVSVLGQVRAPGNYPTATTRTILEVLTLAGGLTDVASRDLTIRRHGTGERIIYFYSNDSKAALNDDIVVYPGDTIIVPKVDVVYTLGDVLRPGGFPMATNNSKLSVLQAVSLAGGTTHTAVPSDARLVRKNADGTYQEIPLPLSDMQKGRKPDMQLQADDIIYVPFSYLRNAALGITSLLAAASSAAIYQF